jgi:putative hydrolase of the HAD superfamily
MYDAKLISHEEFIKEVMGATGATTKRIEEAQRGGMVIDQKLIALISELKKTYKTAILSNVGTNQILDNLLSAEEQTLFDAFIFSYQVGVIKPDPKIYKIALEKLGIEPQEAVFTDDVPRNVEAAKALGIQGIVYEDSHQFKQALEQVLDTA